VRPHHYPSLVLRWKALARRAGVRLRPLVRIGAYPLYYLETPALGVEGGLYLSAGIHGDEPAGPEGLAAWAEANVAQLRDLPLLIFPCLNPWGLAQNMRTDEKGTDLNRSFHRSLPLISAVKKIVGRRRFAASVHLHEDFDGEGLYLYELARGDGWGEALLTAARPILATDPRRRIDRWHAKAGLIRRPVRRKLFERIGCPEALWLFFAHTDRAFTIETPSEIDIERRVAAQAAVLAEVARKVFTAS
jgi:murein peptide amidase A